MRKNSLGAGRVQEMLENQPHTLSLFLLIEFLQLSLYLSVVIILIRYSQSHLLRLRLTNLNNQLKLTQ